MIRQYPCFVWVPGSRGPVPRIWHNESCEKAEGRPVPVLLRYEMKPGDVALPFDVLRRLYPPPIEQPEPKIKLEAQP